MDDLSPEERGVSPVGSGRRFLRSKRSMLLFWGIGGLLTAGAAVMGILPAINGTWRPEQKEAETGPSTIAQVTQTPIVQPPVVEPVKPQEPRIVYVEKPVPLPQAPAVAAAPIDYVQFPSRGSDSFFEIPPHPPRDDKASGGRGGQTETGGTEIAFKSENIEGGKAGKAIRLTYVMMPQKIPCALDDAMDSTLSGSISCHTTQDVLSPDHILLMPIGTQITGHYENGIRQGQNRLFAFAGTAITKEGIPVPLGKSDIGDGLGRNGIPGEVDNHFLQRFGASLALTAFDSAVSIAEAEMSKAGQTSVNLNAGGGMGGLASQILQDQIKIPPTIYAPPGAIVSIKVDHPVSFEEAIRVAAR